MTGLAGAAAVVLAATFAVAARAKFVDASSTEASFSQLGLPRPARLRRAVIVWELLLAALLVLVPAAGAVTSIVTLGAFSGILERTRRSGAAVTCGCFGATSRRPIGAIDLARNAVLALLAALALGAGVSLARPDLAGLMIVTLGLGVAAIVGQLLELRGQVGSLYRIELAGEAR